MTKDLSTEQAETGLMQFWGIFDETSWSPPAEQVPLDAWGDTTKSVFRLQKSMPWWLGDLLNFGETAYGEKYAAVLDEGVYQHGTAQNYAWVCAQWPKQTRHGLPLSFSHHQEVTPLSPGWRKAWMERALLGDQGQNWSTSRLRTELKEWKDLGCPDPAFNADGMLNVPEPPSNGKSQPSDPVIVSGTVVTDHGTPQDVPGVVLDPEPSRDYEPATVQNPIIESEKEIEKMYGFNPDELMGIATDTFTVKWAPSRPEFFLQGEGDTWARIPTGALMELIAALATVNENIKLERGA